MLELHHFPSTAAMVPHIVLEELGVPYRLRHVDRTRDAHKSADYLRLNPNGLIPVLSDGDLVLYETAAICLHLCDTHPAAALAPPAGSAGRAHFYQWLVWLTNTLQATLIAYFYPERWVAEGNSAGAAEVKSVAQARAGLLFDQLEAELSRHGGVWFAGEHYSALDAYVFTLCRWSRHFETPAARTRPRLGPYLERMLARPAVQRVLASDGLLPPFV
jgi:glutathione S-transferase